MIDNEVTDMEIKQIKLIIWDLDDTFWNGTLSEGEISIPESNISLIKKLTDVGVVNSICSKNDYKAVKMKLEQANLWDYFVFPSIDWNPKGERVKSIVDTMKLRYPNVLFIDDNIQNLKEVSFYCPGIMTSLPEGISALCENFAKVETKDPNHDRLAQYHLLEKKELLRNDFSSNEEFLMSCNIRVEIAQDCTNHINRIHDLLIRSNQLNYTKNRLSIDELEALLNDESIKCGYVSVRDKFGDYGIVGFYAVQGGKCLHYVFSCRTLGMQIEQYVYTMLGCPRIEVIGEVVSELRYNFLPPWINQKTIESKEEINKKEQTAKILFKGPCDMSQMYSFLTSCKNIRTEFSYTNEYGILTEGYNHTAQIVTALYASGTEKNEIISCCDFFDKGMLDTALREEKFDFVVLSMLTDGNLGRYRHKETGYEVSLCKKYYDLTDECNRQKYISNEIFTSGIHFTNDAIDNFKKNFCSLEYSCQDTVDNLNRILNYLGNQTTLILLLGSEKEYVHECDISYKDRHIEHANMNRLLRDWATDKPNVILLCYDKYIRQQSDYLDTINHFTKRVYYELAADLVEIFGKNSGSQDISIKGKESLFISSLMQKLRLIKKKILKKMK